MAALLVEKTQFLCKLLFYLKGITPNNKLVYKYKLFS